MTDKTSPGFFDRIDRLSEEAALYIEPQIVTDDHRLYNSIHSVISILLNI